MNTMKYGGARTAEGEDWQLQREIRRRVGELGLQRGRIGSCRVGRAREYRGEVETFT